MDEGQEYARKLIIVALGGCIAEDIYQKKFEHDDNSECQYGKYDKCQINGLLNAMGLSETERDNIEIECRNIATKIINRYAEQLESISKELLNRTIYYSDISAIMKPFR